MNVCLVYNNHSCPQAPPSESGGFDQATMYYLLCNGGRGGAHTSVPLFMGIYSSVVCSQDLTLKVLEA